MISSESASAAPNETSAASWYFSTTCRSEGLPPAGDGDEDPGARVQDEPARDAGHERRRRLPTLVAATGRTDRPTATGP